MHNEIVAEGSLFVRNMETGQQYITGAGGGGKSGGSARTAVEADNTLRSAAVVRVVEVICEGQIVGISGGARGILINNTPLLNADGSYNFPRVLWDYRVGLPSQSYMPGFPSASAEFTLSAPVVLATPVVYSVSDSTVDSALVTIQLTEGLASQNTTNGDINGSSVQFRIDIKRTASTAWETYNTYEISGKTMSAYEAQYRVERPSGSGVWDIRVVRLTADSTLSSLRNKTQLERVTEIVDAKLSYDDTAVVGLAIDAESVGSTIPSRAYQIKGIIVQIPSNYDPVARAYDGIWDGTFVYAWSNNPAWVLYDLLTHPRYGMGEFIKPSMIDKYSFYDASVYNDGLVSDGESGMEPRFTFDGYINTQEEAYKLLQLVAGSMRAKVLEINGKWTVLQDRPSPVVRIITNSEVEDGLFTYASTSLFDRHTAFNVTWNDRSDRYLQKTTPWENAEAIAKYGYVPLDIAAYGVVKESAAIRLAKWTFETEHNETEMLTFTMALNGFDLLPNEIIEVFDEDYAQVYQSGKLVSHSGRQFEIDKDVTVAVGDKLVVMSADWQTTYVYDIDSAQSNGRIIVITADPDSVPENSPYYIRNTVTARPFKIMNLTFSDGEDQENKKVKVEAVNYDATKYTRVETGLSIPPPVFSNTPSNSTVVLRPLDITFTEDAVQNPDQSIQRRLIVGWTPNPEGSPATSFIVSYNKDGDNLISETVQYNGTIINIYGEGLYKFWVLAKDGSGRVSGTALTGSYNITSATAGDSTAVVNLRVKGTSGLVWNTDDLTIKWDPNALGTFVPDYLVKIQTSTNVVLRELITSDLEYNYTFQNNRQDSAVAGLPPQSTLKVTITPRDSFGRQGTATTATFTNPSPASVQNFIVSVGFKSAQIFWDKPTSPDVAGYLIWRSTVPGFTPSDVTFLTETTSTSYADTGLLDNQFYYYQVAAYDSFTRNTDGTGLNFSGVQGSKTSSGSTINEYLLTESIFSVDVGLDTISWTAGKVASTLGTQSGTVWDISAGSAAWTSGVLYVYYKAGDDHLSSSTLLSAVAFDDVVVVATYRGGLDFEAGMGKSFVDGSLILAGTVATGQLAAGSVTADKILVTNLSALSADLGIITAGQLNINNKFIVTSAGNMTAIDGNFGGNLNAATGTFGGALLAGVLDFTQFEGVRYVYGTSGSYSITVPADKTKLRVSGAGGAGGGGGGGGIQNAAVGTGGGGGGASQYVTTTIDVTPGDTVNIVVGAGGAGGAANQSGQNGQQTLVYVNGTLVLTFAAGQGGAVGPNNYYGNASGGAGGAGANGGGNGSQGSNVQYSGYGGAGGTSNIGVNGGAGGNGAVTGGQSNPPRPGGNGVAGKAMLELFNPNSVVLQTNYNILLSALIRQNIQIS